MKYLIVGQGLAGSLIAHRMEELNLSYKIIDAGVNESSRIAAGIINPIVFRRVTKSWRVDEFMPELVAFYTFLEKKLDTSFFFSRKMRRAFSSEQEIESWVKKAEQEEFKSYISHPDSEQFIPSYLNAKLGNALVNQVYYVETKAFLDANRSYFKEHGKLIEQEFEYSSVTDNSCVVNGEKFDRVVFCQGYKNSENPYFNYLPLDPTKGQVLNLTVDGIENRNEILNRKCFLLPLEDGTFKSGATYEWQTPNTILTEEAKSELTEHVRNLISLDFTVTGQEAGVRPTTRDRRPLIGRHPKYNQLYIFNGLGAKGYMLAPLLSKEFVVALVDNSPIDKECSIERFG
jgi:glycine oxidase